jgi:hypothetical protein
VAVSIGERTRPNRRPSPQRPDRALRAAGKAPGGRHRAIVDLQQSAGNRAVVRLIQRDTVPTHQVQPPIKDLYASGTLDETAWKTLRRQAVAAAAKGDAAAIEMYTRLFSDAATTAGVGGLPGFDPAKIHVFDGKAKPGLNLTLEQSGEPGHVAWVDAAGTFGVPFKFDKPLPAVGVGLMIAAQAFKDEKAMSMRTIRHEMVHVGHHLMTLDAIKKWDAAGRKQDFATWVSRNATQLQLSDVDLVLVTKGAVAGWVDTEVLAYVEGFMTEFHRSAPTKDGTAMAFFELLGAVETNKGYTWKQADPKVKREALTRLRSYLTTLDAPHRERWKTWVDDGVAKSSADKTGRKEFYAELATFVR